jgi:glycosyltransferase involved in cell wall biosynthesis
LNKLKDKNKVCAVIPFYNEENTLNEIITRTSKFVDKIILVNDGSTDASLERTIHHSDVIVLDLKRNYGKGFALRAGFDKAVELGFDLIVTLDADLQHDPEFIPELIKASDNYDVVIGNRLQDLSGMPVQRRLSNKLTSYLLSVKTGQKILDSQCGFRVINRDVLMNIKITNNGFEAESEQIILAARNGYRIGFVKISTIYGNEKSKINPVNTILSFIKILFI